MIAAIRNFPHHLHRCFANWHVNMALTGAVVAAMGCALAIFSTAPFFAICFALLTGICLFAAVRLQELGTLKAIANQLSGTEKDLRGQVSRLETQAKATAAQQAQLTLQIAAYERMFEQNRGLLDELHTAIKTDLKGENHTFNAHNQNLDRIAGKMDTLNHELVENTKSFFTVLKQEEKAQFEELKKILQDLNDPGYQAKKLQELHTLHAESERLIGAIDTLKSQQKQMEEKIQQFHQEMNRLTQQNDRLSIATDRIQAVSEKEEGKSFLKNLEEGKISSYGTS